MAKPAPPKRAEYDRLKKECEDLRRSCEALTTRYREVRAELRVQFERIAAMQTILDEERLATTRQPREPHPHLPARSR